MISIGLSIKFYKAGKMLVHTCVPNVGRSAADAAVNELQHSSAEKRYSRILAKNFRSVRGTFLPKSKIRRKEKSSTFIFAIA